MELKLKELTLPESNTKVWIGLNFGEQMELSKYFAEGENKKNIPEFSKALLCKAIKKWNISEELNETNILSLEISDAQYIITELVKMINKNNDFLTKSGNIKDVS